MTLRRPDVLTPVWYASQPRRRAACHTVGEGCLQRSGAVVQRYTRTPRLRRLPLHHATCTVQIRAPHARHTAAILTLALAWLQVRLRFCGRVARAKSIRQHVPATIHGCRFSSDLSLSRRAVIGVSLLAELSSGAMLQPWRRMACWMSMFGTSTSTATRLRAVWLRWRPRLWWVADLYGGSRHTGVRATIRAGCGRSRWVASWATRACWNGTGCGWPTSIRRCAASPVSRSGCRAVMGTLCVVMSRTSC